MNYKEACKHFPGGTQLLSKRPQSNNYPYDYQWSKDIIISSNQKQYKDFSTMGIGSCVLGYANYQVSEAVVLAIRNGNMSSLNTEYEMELAKKLRQYENDKMFRYFRTGGEAMAGAVRTIRSYTEKDIILTNGYNGWHDWYLAGNLKSENKSHLNITTSGGVPPELSGTCYYFDTLQSLEKLINENKQYGNIAGIVLEMARYKSIDINIIEYVKTLGIPIIIDEISTGFRNNIFGMYQNYNINPDIVVYGKAISNGYPFACMCGKKEVMEAINKTFISSTYWTESIGPAAALATINELEKQNYKERDRLNEILKQATIKKFGKADGFNGMIHYYPVDKEKWIEYMLTKNYLVSDQIYLSFAHTENDINEFINIMDEFKG